MSASSEYRSASCALGNWAIAALLFLATAGVVVWQNLRLAVLWDISYILENAHRISLGDVPYRDFPFPYAPLTFLVQALLIKVGGHVYFHHAIYAAIVGGAATVLTWRILFNILRGAGLPSARLVAFLLSLPLIFLGIYSIFPHPFYDPDCTFAILVCILLLQKVERGGFRPMPSFLTGVVLAIPPFVKQNTGLAFLGSAGAMLLALLAIEVWHRRRAVGYVWVLAGIACGILIALALIRFTAGLGNYAHWTMQFAASRRLPGFAEMLRIYRSGALAWWLAAFASGAVLLRAAGKREESGSVRGALTLTWFSIALMAAPFAWAAMYLLFDADASERAERLLALWPFLLVVSFVFVLLRLRRSSGIAMALPFILLGTVHGAFLSQQLWGSTYATWPFFMLLFGSALVGVWGGDLGVIAHECENDCARDDGVWCIQGKDWPMVAFASVVAASMVVAGGFYVRSHERLDYANVSDGEMARATLPALQGLGTRGTWIPDFEELVRYADREIPRDDGLLMIPGEDLFYYATGRRPRFPVLMFDHTVNPYSPEEIARLVLERDIRWLVVKRELQLEQQPVEDRERLMGLLRGEFVQVEALDNYDVYRRR